MDCVVIEFKEFVGGYYVVVVEDIVVVQKVVQDFLDYDLGGMVEICEVMVFD